MAHTQCAHHDRMAQKSDLYWMVGKIVSALVAAASIAFFLFATQPQVEALEKRMDDDGRRAERMESKLDRIYEIMINQHNSGRR